MQAASGAELAEQSLRGLTSQDRVHDGLVAGPNGLSGHTIGTTDVNGGRGI
jgi:hypothetical protein